MSKLSHPQRYLVRDQGAHVREDGHVAEREPGPSPRIRLPLDRGHGGPALAAKREEDHDREGDRNVENRWPLLAALLIWPAGVPKAFPQHHRLFVHFLPEVV